MHTPYLASHSSIHKGVLAGVFHARVCRPCRVVVDRGLQGLGGAAVRQLKKDGADADSIQEAVLALQALKISAGELSSKIAANEPQFNRKSRNLFARRIWTCK